MSVEEKRQEAEVAAIASKRTFAQVRKAVEQAWKSRGYGKPSSGKAAGGRSGQVQGAGQAHRRGRGVAGAAVGSDPGGRSVLREFEPCIG